MATPQPQLATSISQSELDSSRYGFYNEYDIKSKVIGRYPPLKTYWDKIYDYLKVQASYRPTREEAIDKAIKFVHKYIPSTVWIPQYFRNWNKGWLKRDIFAGLSVCFVEVPQGMAYAQLAGFPSINGLYASSFPLILYTLTSSCKVIAGGPVAADSVLMASAIGSLTSAKQGSDEWVEYGCAVSFAAGLILFLGGVFKLGFIVAILSRAVMNGFILAAACIVITSQLPTIFGVSTVHEDIPYYNVVRVVDALGDTNIPTLVTTIISCTLLLLPRFVPRFPKWIPVSILVMILSIILSSSYDWPSKYEMKVVGNIPLGLPTLKAPNFSLFFTVLPRSIIVGLVAYMDAVAMGYAVDQQLAEKYRKEVQAYEKAQEESATESNGVLVRSTPQLVEPVNTKVDGSQEMIAYGLADILGSFMGSQVISASFSRSALLMQMEGHTLLPNLMDALFCIIIITTATSFLYYLPKCVLSAVVLVAAIRLFEDGYREFTFLYNVSRIELLEFLTSFILPLFMTLEVGIVIGIAVSLSVRLFKTGDAPIIELGQIYGGNIEHPQIYYANIKHWKEAKTINGIKIIELRSELSFLNQRKLTEYLRKLINDDSSLKFIVICLVHTQLTDSTALREIISIFDEINDVTICLSHLRKPVRSLLFRYRDKVLKDKQKTKQLDQHLLNAIGEYKYDELLGSNVKTFVSTHDAVLYCQKRLLNKNTTSEKYLSPLHPGKNVNDNSFEIKYDDDKHSNHNNLNIEIVAINNKNQDDNVTVASNNEANIVYQQNDVIDDDDDDDDDDNNNNNNNNMTPNVDANTNNENPTGISPTDEDLRLQSHVRNRFVNIPNAEKPPLQTSASSNEETTTGLSNETYSD